MSRFSVSGDFVVIERQGIRWLIPKAWVAAQEQKVVEDAEAILKAYLAKEAR